MAKKKYLELSEEWEFQMIGIASTMRDFRLAYYLNKMVFLNLAKNEDLPAEIPGSADPVPFSFYQWEENETGLCFYLISNKRQNSWLIPEQKQADFFLLIKGGFSQESYKRFISTIRQIPNVITAFKINRKSDKKIGNFLIELELHTVMIKQNTRKKKPIRP